ncbi:MAG: hypothetical protein ABIC68_00100 [Candidatus Omnitrophota bacterium]
MLKLNVKQVIVLVLGVCAFGLCIYFAPRYKITEMGPGNYIKTEQSSSLYKRSSGKVKFYWGRIFLYEGAIILSCGILMFLLKKKAVEPLDEKKDTTLVDKAIDGTPSQTTDSFYRD